jgi:hypothetical protein
MKILKNKRIWINAPSNHKLIVSKVFQLKIHEKVNKIFVKGSIATN